MASASDPFARAKERHYNASVNQSHKVVFQVPLVTSYGEKLFVSGGCKQLGNWETNRARRMDFDEGQWRCTMEVSRDQLPLEYRFMIVHDSTKSVRWESAPKRTLEIPVGHQGDYVITDMVIVPSEQPKK